MRIFVKGKSGNTKELGYLSHVNPSLDRLAGTVNEAIPTRSVLGRCTVAAVEVAKTEIEDLRFDILATCRVDGFA